MGITIQTIYDIDKYLKQTCRQNETKQSQDKPTIM